MSVAGAQQRHWLTAVAIGAIALLAWPYQGLTPGVEGDWGWVAGLFVAAHERIAFGGELLWTFGPLGLLEVPFLYYDAIAYVVVAYQWLLQLLLAATFYFAARRSYPTPLPLVIAFLAVTLSSSRGVALAFAWCVLALTPPASADPRSVTARWFPTAIGMLAGVTALGKLNYGVEVLAMAAIALLFRAGARRRDAPAFAGAFLATAAIGWFATGQSLGDVWPYLRYGLETIGGYAALQGVDLLSPLQHWAALVVFLVATAILLAFLRNAPAPRRWGMLALWAVYAFASFKQGFTLADTPHLTLFVSSMLVAIAALPLPAGRRWLALACGGALACVVFLSTLGYGPQVGSLNPLKNVAAAGEQLRTLSSEGRRREIHEDLAAAIVATDPPAALLGAVGDRTVAFWAVSGGAYAHAYGLAWRPLPVLEPYFAYTPALDRYAAAMVRSDRAPERILAVEHYTAPGPVSLGRAQMESPYYPPLTSRAILCRYREIGQQGSWRLLARGRNRCGAPLELATTTAPFGRKVDVPRSRRPGAALLVKIDGAEPCGLEALEALLVRPAMRFLVLDSRPYRLAPSTAGEGLMLTRVPGRAPAPAPRRIAVRTGGDQPDGALSYTFLELPVAASGRAAQSDSATRLASREKTHQPATQTSR